MTAALDVEQLLRRADLRVTRPRMAVLSAVHHHPHADTESIVGEVRADLGGVSQQAVYDVLRALTTAGLLRRTSRAGPVARYEPASPTTTTTSCAAAAVPSRTSTAPSTDPVPDRLGQRGFVIDEAEVVYRGVCPACMPTTTLPVRPQRTPKHRRRRNDVTDPSENRSRSRPSGPSQGRRPTAHEPGLVARTSSTCRCCSQHVAAAADPLGRGLRLPQGRSPTLDVEAREGRTSSSVMHDARRTGGRPTTATTARCSSG